MIQVAAAILRNSRNEVLICQRPKGKHCEFLWEFPGGKQEKGETLAECLIRECKEELDIEIEILEEIAVTQYEYPAFRVHITFFEAKILQGEPVGKEHQKIIFAPIFQLSQFQFCPADQDLVTQLSKQL